MLLFALHHEKSLMLLELQLPAIEIGSSHLLGFTLQWERSGGLSSIAKDIGNLLAL
jgi:hypothetical protein